MSVHTVANAQQLNQTLGMAQAGDTIQLEPGDYGAVTIRGVKIDGAVTIVSRDPNNEAVFTGLTVRDSQGLTFSDIELFVSPTVAVDNPFQILSSTNIVVSGLDAHGVVDGDPNTDKSAMLVRNSQNIVVTGSEFHDLWGGVTFLDSTTVAATNNSFHHIKSDGIRGGGTSDWLIASNTFTDFFPGASDHADAIQVWTANTNASARDIRIVDNLVTRGSGAPIQGIFMAASQEIPYLNVAITGNVVIGGNYNGIALMGAQGFLVAHNTVVGYAGQTSWIRLEHGSGGVLANNEAQQYVTGAGAVFESIRNKVISALSTSAAEALKGWIQGHLGHLDVPSALGLSFSDAPGASAQHLAGTSAGEVLTGASADAWIEAEGGNDTVTGTAGTDYLRGGDGDDQIQGGAGADDTHGNAGRDTIHGGDGDDWVVGGKDNDSLVGEAGNDVVYGNLGDDTVVGGEGVDWVRGGQGEDVLDGGAGDDILAGDKGADTISGGGGADKFYFFAGAGVDRVLDFSAAGGDRVQLDPGQTYTLEQGADGAVLRLGAGDEMVLAGVQASSLPSGWIVFG